MSVCVIILGWDTSTRLAATAWTPLPAGSVSVCICNLCQATHRIVFETIAGVLTPKLLDHPEVKPAETYVFQFVDRTSADGWLATNASWLVAKTVYLVDPAAAE